MSGLCQAPIRGREYNRPEVRCRTFEFKSHHQFPARRILYSHNAALLLLPVFRIDEEHRLPREHFHFQRKQSPMSVHYQRVRLFLNAFPFRRVCHHQKRHIQHYALAAPPVTGLGSVHFASGILSRAVFRGKNTQGVRTVRSPKSPGYARGAERRECTNKQIAWQVIHSVHDTDISTSLWSQRMLQFKTHAYHCP